MNYHKIVQQMDEMEMAEFIASNEQALIKEYMTTLFETILGKKGLPKEFIDFLEDEKLRQSLFTTVYTLLISEIEVNLKDKKGGKK